MDVLKHYLWGLLVFLNGGIFVAHLSKLVPTNPNFEPEWFAVFASVIFAVAFLIFMLEPKQ